MDFKTSQILSTWHLNSSLSNIILHNYSGYPQYIWLWWCNLQRRIWWWATGLLESTSIFKTTTLWATSCFGVRIHASFPNESRNVFRKALRHGKEFDGTCWDSLFGICLQEIALLRWELNGISVLVCQPGLVPHRILGSHTSVSFGDDISLSTSLSTGFVALL